MSINNLNLRVVTSEKKKNDVIAVDLDGTLAHYDGWKGIEHIGEPVPKMLERVKKWIEEGKKVKIFTSRMSPQYRNADQVAKYIDEWCEKHVGEKLEIIHTKDPDISEFWDDRSIQIVKNTGERVDGKE